MSLEEITVSAECTAALDPKKIKFVGERVRLWVDTDGFIYLGNQMIDRYDNPKVAKKKYEEIKEALQKGNYVLVFSEDLNPKIEL